MDDSKVDFQPADSQVQKAIPEVDPSDEKKKASYGSRDLQVSALVHLLGLPTKDELKVLEKKVDLLSNKLTSLAGKVDRMLSELSQTEIIGAVERAELQVADLKAILKKVLPKVAGDLGPIDDSSQTRIPKVNK